MHGCNESDLDVSEQYGDAIRGAHAAGYPASAGQDGVGLDLEQISGRSAPIDESGRGAVNLADEAKLALVHSQISTRADEVLAYSEGFVADGH